MGKNVGNMKPTNTNYLFFFENLSNNTNGFVCHICKEYETATVASSAAFTALKSHLENIHGYATSLSS